MPYKRSGEPVPVFMLTVPLKCEQWQRDKLDKVFRCALEVEHCLTSEKLKALKNVERTREWRSIQKQLRKQYTLPKKERDSTLMKLLFERRDTLLSCAGISASAFEKSVKKYQNHYKRNVNSNVAQKIAARVWQRFESYLYGNGKSICFTPWQEFLSIAGKNNATGIRYVASENRLVVGKILRIPLKWNKIYEDGNDRYCYEAQAMQNQIRFCGIVRRWYPDGWRYFAQLCLAGKPPVKVDRTTGECLHSLGKGDVGIDIGPQTVAVVGERDATLRVLAEEVESIDKEIRRLARAMDRSRRATNPAMFRKNGTVVPVSALPQECLDSRGRRKWHRSKRYQRLDATRRALFRKQAELRKLAHKRLINQLLAFGDTFYIEKMNWKALSKRCKKDKVNEKGKHLSKRRFGKSIANKAPATFQTLLKTKVEALSGTYQEIDTVKARASQYEHINHTYKKKKLSQRWAHLPNGDKIQRDLYSAFLIQNVTPTLDSFDQKKLDDRYNNFLCLHDLEVERLKHKTTPSSTGIRHSA